MLKKTFTFQHLHDLLRKSPEADTLRDREAFVTLFDTIEQIKKTFDPSVSSNKMFLFTLSVLKVVLYLNWQPLKAVQ